MSSANERLELFAVFAQDTIKLQELTQDEWWQVCHRIIPHAKRETFNEVWEKLQKAE
jgi:hypothetical protein